MKKCQFGGHFEKSLIKIVPRSCKPDNQARFLQWVTLDQIVQKNSIVITITGMHNGPYGGASWTIKLYSKLAQKPSHA